MNSRDEALRFVPLDVDGVAFPGGKLRLRLTRAKKNSPQPASAEWELKEFAGRTVALDCASHDETWVYECLDVARYQK